MKYTAKLEGNTVRVYDGETLFGSIDFSKERKAEADIFIYNDRFRVAPASATDKDLVVNRAGVELFRFDFDKLWGGAEIVTGGESTGYEVKGKWFKPGTRLVDENSNDLLVITSEGALKTTGMTLEVNDATLSPIMIMSTLYYHIYASHAKTLGVLIAASM